MNTGELTSARRLLRSVFGYPAFRGAQEDIIRTLLGGGDALVLMPTGGGKSLCYQVPSMLRSGVGLVVSPLIALMQDQVAALREHGYFPELMPPSFVHAGSTLQVSRIELEADAFELEIRRDGDAGSVYYRVDGRDPRALGGQPQGQDAGEGTTIDGTASAIVPSATRSSQRRKSSSAPSALRSAADTDRTSPTLDSPLYGKRHSGRCGLRKASAGSVASGTR